MSIFKLPGLFLPFGFANLGLALGCCSIGFAVAGFPLFTPVRIVPAVPGAFLPLNLVAPDAETCDK